MHRYAAILLLLVSYVLGAPCARAGATIVIGPQPPGAVGPFASAKLGEVLGGYSMLEDDGFPYQAFAKLTARDLAALREDQLLTFVVSAFQLGSTSPTSELVRISDRDFRENRPTWSRTEIKDDSAGSLNVTGQQLGGERLFFVANESTGPNAFYPWLYALTLPRSGGPPTLRTRIDLSLAFTGSAEATDVRFVTPPTSDTANGSVFYALVAGNQPDGCRQIKIAKAEYDDFTPKFRLDYSLAVSQLDLCHTPAWRFAKDYLTASPHPERPLWIGGRAKNSPTAPETAAIYKLHDLGTTTTLDTTFGGDGQVKIQHASGLNMRFWDVMSMLDKVYVALGVEGPQVGAYQPIILRLNPDGTLDSGFGVDGIVTIPATGLSTNPRTISGDGLGNIVVTGETYTTTTVRPFAYFHSRTSPEGAPEAFAPSLVEYTFPGFANSAFFTHDHAPDGTITFGGVNYGDYPDASTMRPFIGRIAGPPGTTKAIEYFNAGLGHYAVISIPAEIQALDTQAIPGWTRTGFWFNVYATEAPGTLGVDRFFSDAFAPKSSHFYTNNANEFAILQGSPVWKHEGRTFFAYWPNFGNRCPPNMRPVKRIFNNGVTGAPNHQYADDEAVINQAIARGGVIETGAADGAFFCSQ